MSLALTIAVVLALCGFYFWLGWDHRGDVEETRRWDAGCRCNLTPRQPGDTVTATDNAKDGRERAATVDRIAKAFHDAYEGLAPAYGYRTRDASAVPWADVPGQNKDLMRATVSQLLATGVVAERADSPPTATCPEWEPPEPLLCARCGVSLDDHPEPGDTREPAMNGWVKGGPTALRWHQAEIDSRTGRATLACSGQQVQLTPDTEVMDYRWRPRWDEHCLRPGCQREVQPGDTGDQP